MASRPQVPIPAIDRLKAFLHNGTENKEGYAFMSPHYIAKYDCEDHFSEAFNGFTLMTRCFNDMIHEGKASEIASTILEVYLSGSSPNRHAILYATAKAMNLKNPPEASEEARKMALKVVRAQHPEDMYALVFFYTKIKKSSNSQQLQCNEFSETDCYCFCFLL